MPWPAVAGELAAWLASTPAHLRAAAAGAAARIGDGAPAVATACDLTTLGGRRPDRPGWWVATCSRGSERGRAFALWADLVLDDGCVVLGWWWADAPVVGSRWPETTWDDAHRAVRLDELRALLGVDARGLTGARAVLSALAG